MKVGLTILKSALLAVLMISFTGCEKEELETQSLDAKAIITAPGGKKAPAAEKTGNNLSFPVIWSDGLTKPLRGTFGEDVFNGLYFTADGFDYYVQNDPLNTWQAESFDPLTASIDATNPTNDLELLSISSIDWGDNLEAKDWPYGSQIRVEVVLSKVLDYPMKAYTMKIEDESQSGLTEVWGAQTTGSEAGPQAVTYDSPVATVYSGMAKLVIQKITELAGNQPPSLNWNSTTSSWEGDISTPLFEGGVWENIDGPSGYSAEINVQGKVIYGYNWVTRKTGDGAGTYRITFVLDSNAPIPDLNTEFDELTIVVPKEAGEEITITAEPDSGGGITGILPDYNLTYIDVKLTDQKGSGSGNSGAGGGNSGDKGNQGGRR
ncbi:hypothetical protein [Salinimicrobium sp. TH3]|uniref:hypothetical protein n=1 Tax=Salinimicrobium sp. TH3 TaxID=2997342 RepID=UPI002275276B|nr:hypothetical protein [Salinimicrobium sp. TH3]MCY2686998.1 hypothetical protein [Salinimicrobium sp. TH3]